MRRCVYCGFPVQGGTGGAPGARVPRRTCGDHADLPAKDPGWLLFQLRQDGAVLDDDLAAALLTLASETVTLSR